MNGVIYVARHGQDEDNAAGILNGRRDYPLTELGVNQAKNVSEKLANRNIDEILSSPLKRAFLTAEIIGEKLRLKPEKLDDLAEREFGVMTGKPLADITKLINKENLLSWDRTDYFLKVEDAEDFETTYERAGNVVELIRKEYSNKNILLVAHGDIGKMIRAYYHGWDWKKGLMTPYFDNTHVLVLGGREDTIV